MQKHPGQALLSIFGIALGVAVIIAIDIANSSAGKAFDLSMETVSGKATHRITGGVSGVPDSIFTHLKVDLGLRQVAPVVEGYVRLDSGGTFTLMGIDPFAEEPFRDFSSLREMISGNEIGGFLNDKNSVIISQKTAENLKLKLGDTLRAISAGISSNLVISGILKSSANDNSTNDNSALSRLIITHISNAQEILGSVGYLSRIDIIAPGNDDEFIEKLRSELPDGIYIENSRSGNETTEQMTSAFKTNLTSMSLLALMVGMFLIYNTMTFAVVRRRRLIGLMRSIGVTGRNIFNMIMLEALLLGLLGTLAGIVMGIVLGNVMLELVTRTINDLYFVLSVKGTSISPLSLGKGVTAGIIGTLLAAWMPAHEATKAPPRATMSRSEKEKSLLNLIPRYTAAAVILMAIGTLILLLPMRNIYAAYVGIVFLIIGFSLFSPLAVKYFSLLFAYIGVKTLGFTGKMASISIIKHISRTAIAIAALAIAVAAAIGVGTMIESFRSTVINWLEFRLKADVYVSVPSNISRFNDGTFSPRIADEILAIPEVQHINRYREFRLTHEGKVIHILAAKLHHFDHESFKMADGDNEAIWTKFRDNENVLVTETFAYKNDINVGDSLEIPTDRGLAKFPVAAIYYEYSSDIGLVLISKNVYDKYFDDRLLSGVAVFAKPNADIDALMEKIHDLGGEVALVIRPNAELLRSSVEIFDRTFIITGVLQLLAVGVAFMGILSALMALQMERQRELGILRAIGLTPRQLRVMIIYQTGVMGFIAAVIAIPLGQILALALTNIINKRSFGWSLDFEFSWIIVLQAVGVSVASALLAGLYPAWKMSRTSPAEALRNED